MIVRRPPHLLHRPSTGAMFGEPAVLFTRMQSRTKHGDVSFTEIATDITVASNPLSSTDPRFAALQEAGVRIEDTRVFYSSAEIHTGQEGFARDEIEYDSERYVVHSTARYNGHSESVFVRKEVQS